jgi:hypothetical protein
VALYVFSRGLKFAFVCAFTYERLKIWLENPYDAEKAKQNLLASAKDTKITYVWAGNEVFEVCRLLTSGLSLAQVLRKSS